MRWPSGWLRHLTLLAENNEGYWNLVKLASKAYTEGYYYKPRLDYELMREHSKGIIALSGCLGGEIAQHLAPDGSTEEGNSQGDQMIHDSCDLIKHHSDVFCPLRNFNP